MKTLLLIAALLTTPLADANIARSSAARTSFAKTTACPATGLNKLPCPKYVIDHIVPLCAGGIDNKSNMQWSGYVSSKGKDKEELALCAKIRRGLIKASSNKADLCPVVKAQKMPQLASVFCARR